MIISEDEQKLLTSIKDLEEERKYLRQSLDDLRKKIIDTETDLIGVSLKRDYLLEELRIYRNRHSKVDDEPKTLDAARFMAALPHLMKKIAK